jgi:hypothetical protein
MCERMMTHVAADSARPCSSQQSGNKESKTSNMYILSTIVTTYVYLYFFNISHNSYIDHGICCLLFEAH